MSERPVVHLVCNAHLDPVWLWHWEDGLAEALSTFRIAADFCEEGGGFVFNHNEALLYHWVERFEPGLFARIQKLVAAGSWHIAGGAWLQPDVNGPSGESHIRQFLLGQGYFQSRFGVRPTTAYNFDPFGHPEGFPQILAGCGMDSYIFCRPDHGTYDLPIGCFQWRDRSGSQVLARRSDDHYLINSKLTAEMDRWLPHFIESGERETMILWGVGNHGGGANRPLMAELDAYIASHPDIDFRHSTPEAFFAGKLPQSSWFPVVEGGIQNSFNGCYTSMARVKRGHRRAESQILGSETLAALAWWFDRRAYPEADLDSAWKDIAFAEFHDILPGSCSPDAEADSIDLLGRCSDNQRRSRIESIWALLRGEAAAGEGQTPIFVSNPTGSRYVGQIEVELNVCHAPPPRHRSEISIRLGRKTIPFQRIRAGHCNPGDWRVRLVIPVDLPPFALQRLDVQHRIVETASPPAPMPKPSKATLHFERPGLSLTINPRTGLVDHLSDGKGPSLVDRGAFAPAAFADLDHSWTAGDPSQLKADEAVWSTAPAWNKPVGRFSLANADTAQALAPMPQNRQRDTPALGPIRIVESGPLRTVVEACFVWEACSCWRSYVIDADGSFEIRDRFHINQADHLFKMLVPFPKDAPAQSSLAESPYSAETWPATKRYEEHPNQRWTATTTGRGCLAIANDGSFAFSCTPRNLGLTLLRTPPHSSFRLQTENYFHQLGALPRMDQGVHELRFRVKALPEFNEATVTDLATALNRAPLWQVLFPQPQEAGGSVRPQVNGAVKLSGKDLRVVAVKKAEASEALVVRIQNLGKTKRSGELRVAHPRKAGEHLAWAGSIPPFGLTTVSFDQAKGTASVVNLIEESL